MEWERPEISKKIKDTKGPFHVKMSTVKDRNTKDLKEAVGLRRGGKNMKKNCKKKGLIAMDSHNYVVTHLKSDILECEVKCSLGSITTNKGSGGNGILPELFINLKDGVVEVLHLIYQQIWKTQQWSQDWKR